MLSFDEVKFFFQQFKDGDVKDITYRMALIDTFISKIYLYDGDNTRMEIFCNASNQGINIPIGEPNNSSPMGQLARLKGLEPPTLRTGT